mgnify:CR=1 FL=1
MCLWRKQGLIGCDLVVIWGYHGHWPSSSSRGWRCRCRRRRIRGWGCSKSLFGLILDRLWQRLGGSRARDHRSTTRILRTWSFWGRVLWCSCRYLAICCGTSWLSSWHQKRILWSTLRGYRRERGFICSKSQFSCHSRRSHRCSRCWSCCHGSFQMRPTRYLWSRSCIFGRCWWIYPLWRVLN